MVNKMHYLHRVSNLDPSSRSYITVDFLNHTYIALLLLKSHWTILGLHHLLNFLELQPNPFLNHQGFITLLKNSVPLKNGRSMILLRPKISSAISSMKLVLQASYTVRFTNQTSWINTSTALLIALARVACLCTYRYGTTGHVGALASRILRLISLSLVLDYLHASDHLKKKKDSKPSRTRMTTHIKALRWIALKLDLPILQHLQCQTVSDFLKSKTRIPFERSEASPIPLAGLSCMGESDSFFRFPSRGNPHTGMLPHCHHGLTSIPGSLAYQTAITQPSGLYSQRHFLAHQDIGFRSTMGSMLSRLLYKTIQRALD